MKRKTNNTWFDDYLDSIKKVDIYEIEQPFMYAEDCYKILDYSIENNFVFDWDSLKDFSSYTELSPRPLKPYVYKDDLAELKERMNALELAKPNFNDDIFSPHLSLFDKIITNRKRKKIDESNEKFDVAMYEWEYLKSKIKFEYQNRIDEVKKYEKSLLKWENDSKQWEKEQKEFEGRQARTNKSIDEFKLDYLNSDPNAVIEFCRILLNNSLYPQSFPKQCDFRIIIEDKILVVDYSLPSIDNIPLVKRDKSLKNSKQFSEKNISEIEKNKIFEHSIYSTTLRVINELFVNDQIKYLDTIIFNGWINASNKANGLLENKCILTVKVKKEEFLLLNLAKVDPKVCFKNLKGIFSSRNLLDLTPVKPIVAINRSDKRFVESYNVGDSLDESSNLALMDWKDFEHLIREIFEKIFSVNGGEVKVTQGSRDGGVDAIAFDPDPIRGGKIVIQAKRYTNVIGPQYVRELHGTVQHEGATKGILVTTSDYSSDARLFAQDKPLTLINGAELLYLLKEHGYNAKIDILEAKKIINSRRLNL